MKRFSLMIVCIGMAVAVYVSPASAQDKVLLMATTTSTEDTGLLPVLAQAFKAKTGIELRWVAKGTGQALELGKNCDADVLFVHAPEAEKKFVADGFGQDRTQVMYNDFVLLGPPGDPAVIKGKNVADALKTITAKKVQFVSRGDKSGTHTAELGLWKAAGLTTPDKEPWYMSAGQGMLQTMRMAAERGGYCLADRGTFIKYAASPDGKGLVILVEGDATLRNQYSVITLNPAKCPKAKHAQAKAFAQWLASPEGQKIIGSFTLMEKQLFFPNAAK